jgi:hypothetical protein
MVGCVLRNRILYCLPSLVYKGHTSCKGTPLILDTTCKTCTQVRYSKFCATSRWETLGFTTTDLAARTLALPGT